MNLTELIELAQQYRRADNERLRFCAGYRCCARVFSPQEWFEHMDQAHSGGYYSKKTMEELLTEIANFKFRRTNNIKISITPNECEIESEDYDGEWSLVFGRGDTIEEAVRGAYASFMQGLEVLASWDEKARKALAKMGYTFEDEDLEEEVENDPNVDFSSEGNVAISVRHSGFYSASERPTLDDYAAMLRKEHGYSVLESLPEAWTVMVKLEPDDLRCTIVFREFSEWVGLSGQGETLEEAFRAAYASFVKHVKETASWSTGTMLTIEKCGLGGGDD